MDANESMPNSSSNLMHAFALPSFGSRFFDCEEMEGSFYRRQISRRFAALAYPHWQDALRGFPQLPTSSTHRSGRVVAGRNGRAPFRMAIQVGFADSAEACIDTIYVISLPVSC